MKCFKSVVFILVFACFIPSCKTRKIRYSKKQYQICNVPNESVLTKTKKSIDSQCREGVKESAEDRGTSGRLVGRLVPLGKFREGVKESAEDLELPAAWLADLCPWEIKGQAT